MCTKFYKLPAWILNKGLSARACIVYAIIADRAELSERNPEFQDKLGTYIIYRVKALAAAAGCGERTVKYALAELEDAGLIKSRRQGRNLPSKIYMVGQNTAPPEVQNTAPPEVQNTAPPEVQNTAPHIYTDIVDTDISSSSSAEPENIRKNATQEVQKTAPLINNTDNSNTNISSASSGAEEEERDPAAALVKTVCNRYKLTPTKQIVDLTAERYKRTQTIYNAEKWILTTVQSLIMQEKTKPIKRTYAYDLSEYEKTSILDYDDEE